MTLDMTNNRVPYNLLTDEEKAALDEHEKAGGSLEFTFSGQPIYRTTSLPKTYDVIAWEKLPAWVEWAARDADFEVLGHSLEPNISRDSSWLAHGERRRIDDFPGIVQIGTCDWKDSKQRRPRG